MTKQDIPYLGYIPAKEIPNGSSIIGKIVHSTVTCKLYIYKQGKYWFLYYRHPVSSELRYVQGDTTDKFKDSGFTKEADLEAFFRATIESIEKQIIVNSGTNWSY